MLQRHVALQMDTNGLDEYSVLIFSVTSTLKMETVVTSETCVCPFAGRDVTTRKIAKCACKLYQINYQHFLLSSRLQVSARKQHFTQVFCIHTHDVFPHKDK